MLRRTLPIAAKPGIPRLLVTCDAGNLASQRVIEKAGGTTSVCAEYQVGMLPCSVKLPLPVN